MCDSMGDDAMARAMMALTRAEQMAQGSGLLQGGSSATLHRPVDVLTMFSPVSSLGEEAPTSPEHRMQSQAGAAAAALTQQRPHVAPAGQAGCFYDQLGLHTTDNVTTKRAPEQEADRPGPKRQCAASPCGQQSNAPPETTSTQDHSKKPTGDVWKPIGSGIPLHKVGAFPIAEGELQIFVRVVPAPPPFLHTGGFQDRPQSSRPSHRQHKPVPTKRAVDHSQPPPEPKC